MTSGEFDFVEMYEKLSVENRDKIENWVTYHAPTEEQIPRYHAIKEAARAFLTAILTVTPPCADQSAALRLVREARMTANAAIACDGK